MFTTPSRLVSITHIGITIAVSTLLTLLFVFFLATPVSPAQASVTQTFSLSQSATTSAGVYDPSGVLVRTLWSNVRYPSGSHEVTWDGADDVGTLLPEGSYEIRVLSSQVTYTWEGVVGNTSTAKSGPEKHHPFRPIKDLARVGSKMYYTTGFNEGSPSASKFNLATPNINSGYVLPTLWAATEFIATDGTTVYWGSSNLGWFHPQGKWNIQWWVHGTNPTDDSDVTFTNGINYTAGRAWNAIDFTDSSDGTTNDGIISGLAVQKNGNLLFVSHELLNEVRVLDKITGAPIKTITGITAPREIAVDNNDDIWIISSNSGSVVEHYDVAPDGTLTLLNSITGLSDPLAVAVSPDDSTVLVADAGSSHQLKAFNNTTSAPLWTFGELGGHANGAEVRNDKFYFDGRADIEFESDGSFWVADTGNNRTMHYTADRTFLDMIHYVGLFYSANVDANDPTRAFAGFLEYEIDYSKPLAPGNGSWSLVRNWRYGVPEDFGGNANQRADILRSVTTLSNGRTYAILRCPSCSPSREIVELSQNGILRFTGIGVSELAAEGSDLVITVDKSTNPWMQVWKKRSILGFEVDGNPQYGPEEIITQISMLGNGTQVDPDPGGSTFLSGWKASDTGIIPVLQGSTNPSATEPGWHFGGLDPTTNQWVFKEALATGETYRGLYPDTDGFDVGNSVLATGATTRTSSRNFFWNYYGESWKGGQVNMWTHVYDDGLVVGRFGNLRSSALHPYYAIGWEAPPGVAGNVFSTAIAEVDGKVYIYHNDEIAHAGIHRWRVDNLDSITEQSIPVTLSHNLQQGLTATYYDDIDVNNTKIDTMRVDPNVDFSWGTTAPVGTTLGSDNYSVRWEGFVKPNFSETYTFYTNTDEGVRLWVGGKLITERNQLLVDQWSDHALTEHSGTIELDAGKWYPIRMEYYEKTGSAQAQLSWSSASQPKQIIPTTNLLTKGVPAPSNAIDLHEGFVFPSKTLEDNLYGWTVSTPEINTPNVQWLVRTGEYSYRYDQPMDVTALFYRDTSGGAYVDRDLTSSGASDSSEWVFETMFSEDGSRYRPIETNRVNGRLQILDDTGKIIAQVNNWEASYNNLYQIRANDQPLVEKAGTVWGFLAYTTPPRPLRIAAQSGQISFEIDGYPPLLVDALDPTANLQRPRTLRLDFSTTGRPYSQMISLSNTTFTLNSSGTTPPPTASLTASPTSITEGSSSTLTWSSTNATSCTGTNFSTGGATNNATGVTVSPPVTTTYTITCTGSAGPPAVDTATVTVTPPAGDTTPPIISALTSSNTTDTTTDITFTTDEGAVGQIEYGTTLSYGSLTTVESTYTTTHSFTLSSLLPNTLYHYRALAEDSAGNLTISADQTFTTDPAPVPPTATLDADKSSVTSGSPVTLTWSSTDATSCTGTNFSTGGNTSGSTTLNPTVTTTYTLTCTGAIGPPAVDTTTVTVTASPPPDTTPPVIGSITETDLSTLYPDIRWEIAWTTDEPANSRIDYGTSPSSLNTTVTNPAFITNHALQLPNLKRKTTYYYTISSSDAGGYTQTTAVRSFTTGGKPPKAGGASGKPGSIILTWDPLVDDSTITGIQVYRTNGQSLSYGTLLTTLPRTATTYTDTTVNSGTYTYTLITVGTPIDGETLSDPVRIAFTKVNRGQGNLNRTFSLAFFTYKTITGSTPPIPTTLFTGIDLEFKDVHPDVKVLQETLNQLGYSVTPKGPGSKGNETTYFGPSTRNALIRFQTAYADELLTPRGLKRGDGVLEALTRAKLEELSATISSLPTPPTFSLYRTLLITMRGEDVRNLQKLLNSKGHIVSATNEGSPGNETIYFGPATRDAVRSFQCSVLSICSGTESTTGYGSVGPLTREALG
jgi:hypothetical protein